MRSLWTVGALSALLTFKTAPVKAADPAGSSVSQTKTEVNESFEKGVNKVSEGTREAAKSVNAAAEEASKEAAALTAKVGHSIKAATCPVVGDRKTKLYYAADSKSYAQVLEGQKYFEDDDRACWRTEDAARAEGYTRSAN